jgi:hypothetical protein
MILPSTLRCPTCRLDTVGLQPAKERIMDLLDPRLALLTLGVAAVTSERVRKTVGRGIGYVAAGTMTVGGTVAHAGRDIVDEAREVASHNGTAKPAARKKATAGS